MATYGAIDANYRASGAGLHPFQAVQLPSRHTSQINSDTTSAEEFPWKSMQQGGRDAHVFPATEDEQHRMSTRDIGPYPQETLTSRTGQGGHITDAYRDNGVGYNNWFTVTFTPRSLFGIYCRALFQNPPDFSVCEQAQQEDLFNTRNVPLRNYGYGIDINTWPKAFYHIDGPDKGKIIKRTDEMSE